jgi:hypothetical protein
MSLRAIFTRFDHFMAMFIALFAVVWSSVFMPLLGGPLHTYEARAIGAGVSSLQTGANIREAFDVATSLPAEIMLPSAHAEEAPLQLVAVEAQPAPLELLGGPDVDVPIVAVAVPHAPRMHVTRVAASRASAAPVVPIEASAALPCDIPAIKQGLCEAPSSDALAAST